MRRGEIGVKSDGMGRNGEELEGEMNERLEASRTDR